MARVNQTLLKLLSRDLYPVAQAESYVRVYGQERWDVWELRSRFGLVSHDLQQQYVGNARGLNIILSGFYSSIDIAWHHRFSDDDRARAQKVLDNARNQRPARENLCDHVYG